MSNKENFKEMFSFEYNGNNSTSNEIKTNSDNKVSNNTTSTKVEERKQFNNIFSFDNDTMSKGVNRTTKQEIGEDKSISLNNLNYDGSNNEKIKDLVKLKNVDDDLLKVFIGDNYEKIVTHSFNFASFFSGPFYFLYRKMLLFGIIIIIIELLISLVANMMFTELPVILKNILIFIVSISIMVCNGMIANRLYLIHTTRKINRIRNKGTKNKEFDLIKASANEGGTNTFYPLVALIITIGIPLLIFVISSIGNAIKESRAKTDEMEKKVNSMNYGPTSMYLTNGYKIKLIK